MPCDSSHMEPTARELHRKAAARSLVYLHERLGLEPPAWAAECVADLYGGPNNDRAVTALCAALRKLSDTNPGMFLDVVYDGSRRESRRLADWWEDHLEEDKKAGRE